MNTSLQNGYTETGALIVSVYTASGAIPIEGAVVTIYGSDKNDSEVKSVYYTDRSGNTEKIFLPAPPAAMSEVPGNVSPFAKYNVEVDKEGFNSRTFINVPVFAKTTSIQPVNMVPMNEYNGEAIPSRDSIVTESQSPNL